MITIFKNKKDIPESMEYIELNDLFFNKNTVMKIDEKHSLLVSIKYVQSLMILH